MTVGDPDVPAVAGTKQFTARDLAVLGIAGVGVYLIVNHVLVGLTFVEHLWEENRRFALAGLAFQGLAAVAGCMLFAWRWSLAGLCFTRDGTDPLPRPDLVEAQAAVFSALGLWFLFDGFEFVLRLAAPFVFQPSLHAPVDRIGVFLGVAWLAASALLFFKGRALAQLWNRRRERA